MGGGNVRVLFLLLCLHGRKGRGPFLCCQTTSTPGAGGQLFDGALETPTWGRIFQNHFSDFDSSEKLLLSLL